ncbi:hypothetical protein D3C84_652590 [compost metagenome]
MPAVLSGGGEDENVPALIQRKGHDLALRGRPPPFGERLNVGHMRDAVGRHNGAIGDHSGKTWLLITEQRIAHHRMDAVSADQQIGEVAAAILEVQFDTVGGLQHALGALGKLHLFLREDIGQCGQQVGAVDGQLRRAVFLFGGIGHFQARGFHAAVPHPADPVSGTSSGNTHCWTDTQAIQGMHGVRCQVDVGSDPQKGFGLFENGDVMADTVQGNGGGQSTDPGAGNGDIQRRHVRLLLRTWVCR